MRYFDTFDWRLYRKGLALIQAGNAVYLQQISGGEYPLVRDQIEMKSCDLEGRFWWMFPEGELRDYITGCALGSGVITSGSGDAEGLRIWRFECR